MKATLPILLCSLPLAIAARPAQDTLDLTPRYEAGQSFAITQAFEGSADIDDVSVQMDGQEMMEGGVEGSMEMSGNIDLVEKILEVREGKPSKMTVLTDAGDVAVSGSFNAMGEGDDFDESIEMPAVGHTVEITIDEEGDITRKDITEEAEPLSDEEMAQISYDNHLDMLLPTEPVTIGEPFSIEPDWDDLMSKMMANMESGDLDGDAQAAAETMMRAFADGTEIDATGTVTGVEDGIATIEYEISVSCQIDDLMGLIAEAVPDAAGEMPPANASMTASADMQAVVLFNVAEGYLTSTVMSGEFAIDLSGDMNMGQQMDAAASFSGEFSAETTIEKQ